MAAELQGYALPGFYFEAPQIARATKTAERSERTPPGFQIEAVNLSSSETRRLVRWMDRRFLREGAAVAS